MGIGNHEVADHPTKIAMSDRIKDSIALIDMFVCAADGCQCDRKGMMTSCTRGSFRQTIRLFNDLLVLNVLIWCASYRMEMVAIISLRNNTEVAFTLFYFYVPLYST